MDLQNGAFALTGSACPSLANRYLLSIAPDGSNLILMIVLEVLPW